MAKSGPMTFSEDHRSYPRPWLIMTIFSTWFLADPVLSHEMWSRLSTSIEPRYSMLYRAALVSISSTASVHFGPPKKAPVSTVLHSIDVTHKTEYRSSSVKRVLTRSSNTLRRSPSD